MKRLSESTAAVDASLAGAVQAERLRHSRMMATLRLCGVGVFCGLFFVFDVLLKSPLWKADWWLLLPYLAVSGCAWLLRGSEWHARRCGALIGLVDVPVVFVLQAFSLTSSSSPGGVAGFTLGLFAFLIMLASLSFQRQDLLLAMLTAAVCEVALQRMAGLGAGAWAAAILVIGLVGTAGRYINVRVYDLAILIYRNLSTQAKLRSEMSDTRGSFETLIEGLSDVVLTFREGMVAYANLSLVKLAGYALPTELEGQPVSHLFEQIPNVATGVVEVHLIRRDGSLVTLEATCFATPLWGQVHTVLVGRDVTERKQVLQQLSLNDRMATMGLMAAGIAHEINNPLAAVRGNLELLQEAVAAQQSRLVDLELDDLQRVVTTTWERVNHFATQNLQSTQRHDLANILTPLISTFDLAVNLEFRNQKRGNLELAAAVQRTSDAAIHVASIAQNLKTLAGPLGSKNASLHLRPTVEAALAMALHVLRGKSEVSQNFEDDIWILGSAPGLIQVLINLLANAGHAVSNSPQKRVSITCRRLDKTFGQILVEDTGSGIPESVQKNLFKPFFTTKPAGVGVGIGLSLSKRIVESMGGTLTFSSQVGVGTCFVVKLALAAAGSDEISRAPHVSQVPEGRRGRVLVLDDNETVSDVVRRALVAEHDVDVYKSAQEALKVLADGARFDVMLCDMLMPDMTGLQWHQHVAQLSQQQAERIVFMSGSPFSHELLQGADNLPNLRVEKPFDVQEMRDIVRRQVGQS